MRIVKLNQINRVFIFLLWIVPKENFVNSIVHKTHMCQWLIDYIVVDYYGVIHHIYTNIIKSIYKYGKISRINFLFCFVDWFSNSIWTKISNNNNNNKKLKKNSMRTHLNFEHNRYTHTQTQTNLTWPLARCKTSVCLNNSNTY